MDQNTPNDFTDPATIQMMAELGITPDLLALLGKQMHRGESMMDTPMAQGRNVGNTYVAASPLEHLATAVRQYQGGKMAQQAGAGYQSQLQGPMKQGIAAGLTEQDRRIGEMIQALRKRQEGAGTYQGEIPQPIPDIPGAFP